MRNVDLIEDEQACGEDGAEHDHRQGGAIEADAGGLHGRQLARLFHQPEGDQHGQHHGDGRHQVDKRWAEVQQVLGQQQHRYFVAHDVGQQLKEGEHQRQDQEGAHDHRQIHDEVAQDHVVQNERKAGAEAVLARMPFLAGVERSAAVGGGAIPGAGSFSFQRFPERGHVAQLAGHAVRCATAAPVRTGRKRCCRPTPRTRETACPGAPATLPAAKRRSRRTPAAMVSTKPVLLPPLRADKSQWNADHGQHQAGGRQAEAPMELDLVIARLQSGRSRR